MQETANWSLRVTTNSDVAIRLVTSPAVPSPLHHEVHALKANRFGTLDRLVSLQYPGGSVRAATLLPV